MANQFQSYNPETDEQNPTTNFAANKNTMKILKNPLQTEIYLTQLLRSSLPKPHREGIAKLLLFICSEIPENTPVQCLPKKSPIFPLTLNASGKGIDTRNLKEHNFTYLHFFESFDYQNTSISRKHKLPEIQTNTQVTDDHSG